MEKQEDKLAELLVQNGLKRTLPRLKVLDILSKRDSATSQPFLEKVMGSDADRVTLYRILQTFEEKGIIHKVLDGQGTANYALCTTGCSQHEHHDEHLHFNCRNCQRVYCLDAVRIPRIKTPPGFSVENISLTAVGLCSYCSDNKSE
ncbi:Fur family transcriptional regulator [Pedobacter sp. Leaf176]|nr:Fur family transcriptional regulator [Pedobacter sp. Leaf176]